MNKKYSLSELVQLLSLANDLQKIHLDLGCGNRKRIGYIGVDAVKLEGVDIVCNLEEGFPFEDNIIDGIYSRFLFEHIANTIFLFQELYRICKNGAIIEFKVPYYQSVTQYKDPTHKAMIMPEMLRYFSDDKWYGSDYGIKVTFRIIGVHYEYLRPCNILISKKLFFLWPITYPFLLFARRFFWNVVHSVTIEMEVVK